MKTIYEMSAKELKEIARAKYMHGAWKATKAQMIAFLEEIGYEPETETEAEAIEEVTIIEEPEEIVEETIEAVEVEDLDTDEEETATIEEVETEEPVELEETETFEEEAEDEGLEEDDDEDEEEETTKVVKKPSLGINSIEFNGKMQSLKAWAEELEMPWPTLYDRINRNGWTIEEALTIPLGGRRKKRA